MAYQPVGAHGSRRSVWQRIRKVVTLGVGWVLLIIGAARVADIPALGLDDLPITLGFLLVAALVLRSPWARRPAVAVGAGTRTRRRRQALAWLSLGLGAAALVGSALAVALPIHVQDPIFVPDGDTCGSGLLPRHFAFDSLAQIASNVPVSVECDDAVHNRQGQAIFLSELGIMLIVLSLASRSVPVPLGDQPTLQVVHLADDRDHVTRARSGSVVLVGSLAVILAVSGVVAAVHIRGQSPPVRPFAGARPAAAETCMALLEWNRSDTEAAATFTATRFSTPYDSKVGVMRFVAQVEQTQRELMQRLDAVLAKYQVVPGVPDFLGLIREQMMGPANRAMPDLMAQAQALPVDTWENVDWAKKRIADGFHDMAPSMMNTSDLNGVDVADTASVVVTFADEPACAGIL